VFNGLSKEQGGTVSADRQKNSQEINSTFTFSTGATEKRKEGESDT